MLFVNLLRGEAPFAKECRIGDGYLVRCGKSSLADSFAYANTV